MRALLSTLVPVAALFLFLGARQIPAPQPHPVGGGQEPPKPIQPPEIPLTPSPGALKEIERTTKAMQGLWVLKELVWPHIEGLKTEFRGFCMVADNHLDFEVHIGVHDQSLKLNNVMLDSGIWRFEVGEANRTVMTSLIGSFIDKDNRVAFREEGTRVRYDVIALGDQMTWRKEDGQRLVFERLADFGPKRVDIFGRPVQDKKDEAPKDPGAKSEPRKEKD